MSGFSKDDGSGFTKGLDKVRVTLKWDPTPMGEPDADLDLVAATYTAGDPYGEPEYLVHFDSRAPDGTITLDRDSRTGQGFGPDEEMTLELDRLADSYGRVVVGVAIQQAEVRRTFGGVANPQVEIHQDITELFTADFSSVAQATSAVVAEFARDENGEWEFTPAVRGFDAGPEEFTGLMGRRP